MKVLVGFPPTQSPLGTPLLSQNRQFKYFEKPTFLYPVVLGTAATMAKKAGHEVIWEDAIAQNMDWRAYDEMLSREKPDIFLFETKAPVVKKHWEAINHIKNKFPNIKIVICGDHVSYLPGETLENSEVDYVINGGYFDFAFMELVEWLDGNKETKVPNGIWHRNKKNEIVENGRYFLKNNLDDAPFPDRKLTKYMDYQDEFNLKGRPQFYIMSARDCAWGKCTFCFHPEMDVVTEEGIKLIKDIKVGEEVLTHDGSYGKTDFVFEREYNGEMIHITTNNTKEIICTPNHKLFVLREENKQLVRAENLRVSDILVGPAIQNTQLLLNKGNGSIQLIKPLLKSGDSYFKIIDISKEEYHGLVYNLSVPGNRTYVCNLISVSNCVWDHALYPKGSYKQRSPENTFEEVKHLVDDLGAREIFDDAGTIPPGLWLKKFCEIMISSGYNKKVMYSCNMRFGWVDADMYKLMKKAGFRLLKFGLESGCQKTIDKLDKGTDVNKVHQHCKDAKDAGLTVHITMMVGYPWETKEDAMKTFNLAKDLMHKGLVDIHQSTVVMPYPGTPLYEEAAREGWLRFEKTDYEKLAMDQPAMKTINMTPEEVQGICKLNYKIYLHPKYVWQHAKSRIKSWEDVKYTWEGFTAVIGHIKDFSRKPELQRDKSELLSKEQVARMNANLHNPRQDLVAIKPGATEPIPYRHIEEVKVEMPLQIVR